MIHLFILSSQKLWRPDDSPLVACFAPELRRGSSFCELPWKGPLLSTGGAALHLFSLPEKSSQLLLSHRAKFLRPKSLKSRTFSSDCLSMGGKRKKLHSARIAATVRGPCAACIIRSEENRSEERLYTHHEEKTGKA